MVDLEGCASAVTANSEGQFSLSFTSTRDSVVVFSRVGYKRAEYEVEHSSTDTRLRLQIEMVPVVSDLEVAIESTISHATGMAGENMSEVRLLPSVTGNTGQILPPHAMDVSRRTGGGDSRHNYDRGGKYDENRHG